MSVPEVNTKVRYRGCLRNKHTDTQCTPQFQRQTLDLKDPKVLGNFTDFFWLKFVRKVLLLFP